MPKYKIILDTNFVFMDTDSDLSELFNSNILEIRKFITDNSIKDVQLTLPEIVLRERMAQRLAQIKITEKAAEKNINQILNIVKNKFRINPKQVNYGNILKKKGMDKLKNLNVEIIKVPKINHEEIVERAFIRKKPFSEKDKGYKDTLLWMTLMTDAKKNQGTNYILCTSNLNDFNEDVLEEFATISKMKITIIPNLPALTEFLDKTFVLKLELKALHDEVSQEILKNSGNLMASINSFDKSNDPLFASYHSSVMSLYTSDLDKKDNEKKHYNFKSLKITDMKKSKGSLMKLKLVVTATYKNEKPRTRSWALEYSTMRLENRATTDLSVDCTFDRTTGEFSIHNIYDLNSYYPRSRSIMDLTDEWEPDGDDIGD
jgi:hypothetical protein